MGLYESSSVIILNERKRKIVFCVCMCKRPKDHTRTLTHAEIIWMKFIFLLSTNDFCQPFSPFFFFIIVMKKNDFFIIIIIIIIIASIIIVSIIIVNATHLLLTL